MKKLINTPIHVKHYVDAVANADTYNIQHTTYMKDRGE
jgi:hypothetical protein